MYAMSVSNLTACRVFFSHLLPLLVSISTFATYVRLGSVQHPDKLQVDIENHRSDFGDEAGAYRVTHIQCYRRI